MTHIDKMILDNQCLANKIKCEYDSQQIEVERLFWLLQPKDTKYAYCPYKVNKIELILDENEIMTLMGALNVNIIALQREKERLEKGNDSSNS